MKRYTALSPLVLLILSGCSSLPVMPLTAPSSDSKGEILVFREYAFAAGGVGLAVGTSGKAFANLGTTEKVSVMVVSGSHEIFVQARSAEPTKLRVEVPKDGRICLRTGANPDTWMKVLVPNSLIATGYNFYLDRVPCPKKDELEKYKNIPVAYQ